MPPTSRLNDDARWKRGGREPRAGTLGVRDLEIHVDKERWQMQRIGERAAGVVAARGYCPVTVVNCVLREESSDVLDAWRREEFARGSRERPTFDEAVAPVIERTEDVPAQ